MSHTRKRVRTIIVGLLSGAVAFLLVGNLAILTLSAWARTTSGGHDSPAEVPGVEHLLAIDDRVWRGSAPGAAGYAALAAAGVTTVIDLRAEENVRVDDAMLARLGMRRVSIPVRDGQAPSPDKVREFLDTVATSPGLVFLHCGAGVGRTGSMAAAYLVANGRANANQAVRTTLAVGPPSLEQLAFIRNLADGRPNRPGPAVTAVSRVLDAPRRLWSRYGM